MNLLIFNLAVDKEHAVLAFSTDWINALSKKADKVSVITMRVGEIKVNDNVKVYSVGSEKGYSKVKRAFLFYKLLFKIIRNDRIDACFSHMMPLFSIMGGLVLKLLRKRHVLWYAHGKLNWKVKVADKLVDNIITSSSHGCRLNSPKVKIIGQGIDIQKMRMKTFDGFKKPIQLLFVGRLTPTKNIHLLVKVMKKIDVSYASQAILTIVGNALSETDQQYVDEVKRYVSDENIGHIVKFIGHVPFEKIESYYKKANVFINPSNTGSMDKTVLEAMATGLLVVTGNEAYDTAAFRNAGGYYTENEADSVYECLMEIFSLGETDVLDKIKKGRDWVEKEHSINTLSDKIYHCLINK